MSDVHAPSGHPRLQTPSGARRPGQPWWNPQRTSLMPAKRYVRDGSRLAEDLVDRTWPARAIDYAPLWCSVDLRDGNQSLANPMNLERKGAMFDLLVKMGFKEIEVGYPSASEADFAFVRALITQDRIPDDVTISVFTPARIDLIGRTFEAIDGADRGMVHLCLATACLWREVVFQMSPDELKKLTVGAAEHVARLAQGMPRSSLRFEYSPETFNVTEPEFALAVSNEVVSVWDACAARPVTLNLPSTVETDSPNVFADQIEWMHRNLDQRQSIILSVHPHNDRGTAVASAEFALAAGADRVEGTLFGNGERTGNVCLATLALNLFSRGVDPQIDFSDIDDVRRTVEFCNQMPVHARHPYVGDLVYTAFSGTHQDAIAKGFAALKARAQEAGLDRGSVRWEVPYLPIDPKDVGRTYESVIRVNSQSGKGGIAHVLRSGRGLDLPRDLRIEFAKLVQKLTDETGIEINSRQLWDTFTSEYLEPRPLLLKYFGEEHDGSGTRLDVCLATADGVELTLSGSGDSTVTAFIDVLASNGWAIEISRLTENAVSASDDGQTVVYAEGVVKGVVTWGVGMDTSSTGATLRSVLSSLNRALR
jgi:2-isopropylmalate synthase